MLDYLPVGLFGSVMGLTALSVAWHLAQARYGTPEWVAPLIAATAVLAFVSLLIGYGVKLATAPDAVRAEFRHPIAGNLFGTVPISLLLLPIVVPPYARLLAQALWISGAVGMVLFAWFIVNRWMSDRQQAAHATPAWIIPVVGLLDVPLALPSLGLPPMHGLMVFALAVGLFFAVPLFTLVFSRLVFEPPLPDALKPSLLILAAPFAVGYSAYSVTAGQADLFAEALYMLMLFVRRGFSVRATPPHAGVLPVPRVLVGGQLPARGVEHRSPALRRISAGARHGRDRLDLAGCSDPGDRGSARPNGTRPVERGAAEFEYLGPVCCRSCGRTGNVRERRHAASPR